MIDFNALERLRRKRGDDDDSLDDRKTSILEALTDDTEQSLADAGADVPEDLEAELEELNDLFDELSDLEELMEEFDEMTQALDDMEAQFADRLTDFETDDQ